jgi:DNA-binding NarL/FixJ family response regulator
MEDQRLTAIIVEDQQLGIDCIRHCMGDGYRVVAACQTVAAGWQAFQQHLPDVVVLDIELPDGNGLELADRMLRLKPKLRILGVSASTDAYTLYQVFMRGFFGFVDKSQDGMAELGHALASMARGQSYYAAKLQQNILALRADPAAFPRLLSEREQDLMRYFGVGASNEWIAEQLRLRPASVQNHRARIMRKLGVHSTVELIQYAVRTGFVNLATLRRAGEPKNQP